MAYIKTKEEIQLILEGGKILGEVLEKISKMVKPGVSTWDIDLEAEKLIKEAGGRPSFKNYKTSRQDPPFPGTICASINEEIVHGIPKKDKILKKGDIFTIDIGMQYPVDSGLGKGGNGFFTDTALTLAVGQVSADIKKLLDASKKSLEKVIENIQSGDKISDIGKIVENYVRPLGYDIVRDLGGHGVGHGVHEEPFIPNYYNKNFDSWILEVGSVLAVEPMITMGDYNIEIAEDGWSISTVDKSLSAHFEHTLVVTEDGVKVATRRPDELK